MTNLKRIFLAAHIHSNFINSQLLSNVKHGLQHEKISWTNSEQMHVTVKFFGETNTNSIAAIDACIRNSITNIHSFNISVLGLSIFGSSYQPKVLYAKIDDNNNFEKIFLQLQQNLIEIGYLQNRQNFVPHISLGRIKKLTDKQYFQNFLKTFIIEKHDKITINELTLFESILKPEGAKHYILENYKI